MELQRSAKDSTSVRPKKLKTPLNSSHSLAIFLNFTYKASVLSNIDQLYTESSLSKANMHYFVDYTGRMTAWFHLCPERLF